MKPKLFFYIIVGFSLFVNSCTKADIESENYKDTPIYSFVNNYLEGEEAVVTELGNIISIKVDSISGYQVQIDSMDLSTSQWCADKSLLIKFDNEMQLQTVLGQDGAFYFDYEGDCPKVTFVKNDTTQNAVSVITLDKLSKGSSPVETKVEVSTKAVQDNRWKAVLGNVDNVTTILGLLKTYGNASALKTAGSLLGGVSNILGNLGFDVAALGVSGTSNVASICGGALSRANLMLLVLQTCEIVREKFLLSKLGQNIYVNITNVKRISLTDYDVSFEVSGIKSDDTITPALSYMCIYKNGSVPSTNGHCTVKNGNYVIHLKNLVGGMQTVSFNMYVDELSLLGSARSFSEDFFVGYNSLEDYKLETNKYDGSEHSVTYKFKTSQKLNLSAEGVLADKGIYIKENGSYTYFRNTGNSEELSVWIKCLRENYYMVNCYPSLGFEAEYLSDCFIGAYSFYDGQYYYYDEKSLDEELKYTEEPVFNITCVTVTERGSTGVEDGRDRYIKYKVECLIKGAFFINEIHRTYGENWTVSGSDRVLFSNVEDGNSFWTGTIYYSSKNTSSSPISFYANLVNGRTMSFNQGLVFCSGNINISGSSKSCSTSYYQTKTKSETLHPSISMK